MGEKQIRQVRYGGAVTGWRELWAIFRSALKSTFNRNWQEAEEGKKFTQEACKFLGVKYGILTNSGSSAGLLALSALELPKGSEVIIGAVTFPTIFNIIIQCGLVPVVVDCKIGSYGFEVEDVEKAITKKTKAIIAINIVGNPCDTPKLRKIIKKQNHKIWLLSDNCDGFGTTIKGKSVESYADISFTSFHAAHIVSMGVGGGIFTDDENLAKNVRMYRDWGRQANTDEPNKYDSLPSDYNPRFIYEKIGYNFQILELQAAMGRVQLRKVKKIKESRQRNFDYLYKHLGRHDDLVMPLWIEGADVCWFAFPLTYEGDRGPLIAHLEKNGIETRSMFAGNILAHPAYANSTYKIGPGGLDEANYILKHSFFVSCHPSLTKNDMDYMIKTFKTYLDEKD